MFSTIHYWSYNYYTVKSIMRWCDDGEWQNLIKGNEVEQWQCEQYACNRLNSWKPVLNGQKFFTTSTAVRSTDKDGTADINVMAFVRFVIYVTWRRARDGVRKFPATTDMCQSVEMSRGDIETFRRTCLRSGSSVSTKRLHAVYSCRFFTEITIKTIKRKKYANNVEINVY